MEAKQLKKDQNCNILGDNLRKLLDNNHLNITQAAAKLSLPIMTIRRLLSGETADPRLSTLTIITDYFKISIDQLVAGIQVFHSQQQYTKPQFVPILDWQTASKINSIHELALNAWPHWQSISNNQQDLLSENVFALETKPSLYSRFPKGALFIIDPNATATDGDIVLVKIKDNNEMTLREIYIDPPEKQLQSLVPGASTLIYSEQTHIIVGVNILTMLYNRNV